MLKENSKDVLVIDSDEAARSKIIKLIANKIVGNNLEFSNSISPFQKRGKGKAKNRKNRWS